MNSVLLSYTSTMLKPLPLFKVLDQMFEVSPNSPSGLVWKNPRSTKLKPCYIAGTKDKQAYWNVGIKLNDKTPQLICIFKQ
jgi:hypothetical protein